MDLFVVVLPIFLFLMGVALFKKSKWKYVRHVIVLWAFYAVLSFGIYSFASAFCMENANLMISSGVTILATLVIFAILFVVDKIIEDNKETTKKASDVIYSQGSIVKAVKEGTDFNQLPIVSYYYLVIEYEVNGKKEYCKTKRSYTLGGISYLLKKYPIVSLEIRDGYTRLPDVPKEEMTAKYDPMIFDTIKFDNMDRLEEKKKRGALCVLPLSVVVPTLFFAHFMFIDGQINIALIIIAICSAFISFLAAWASRGIY